MTDIIGTYAQLSLQVDAYLSAGRPVPFQIKQAMDRIETQAQQTMSPAQLNSALSHVEAAKVRILSQEQAAQHASNEQGADNLARSMTRGMLGRKDGLTRAEIAQVRKGGKLTFRGEGETFDPKKASAALRKATGLNLEQYEERMESLVNADDDKMKRLAKQLDVPEAELKSHADNWRESRYEYEMRKRQASPVPIKDEVVAVTDDEQRRAEVIGAYAEHMDSSDRHQVDEMFNNVTDESLEDEGMRGDIAMAFVQSEERGNV